MEAGGPIIRIVPLMMRARAIRTAALAAAAWMTATAAGAALRTSSWITYIDQKPETVDLYGRGFETINVFAYSFDANDNLIPARPWVDATLARLRANPVPGREVFITIVNDIETNPPSNHDGALIDRILRDPAKRAEHIRQLVALSARADGLDIDYESLQGRTRDLFTQFIRELRAALPAGKKIAVDAQPKTDDLVGDRGRAMDWRALAPHIDYLRVMVYYYSWSGSPPGPVVTLSQLRAVTRFALSQVPAAKLNITLTLFGNDWPSGSRGQLISHQQALDRARQFGATPFRDPNNLDLRVNYTDASGRAHQIWMDDDVSLRAKLDAIRAEGTDRVDFWSLGSGDPRFWEYVRSETGGGSPPPPPPPPPPGAPSLASLSPASATAGGPAFTLTVNGSNLSSGSTVRWNGSNRPTTFVSASQLRAAIPASDIAAQGAAAVTVANAAGVSNALTFTVAAPPNPGPGGFSISALSPNTRPAGGAAFNLTVDGTGFVSGAVVRWNGLNRPGVLQGTTRLIVYIGPGDVASPQTASVTVANPNGAVSNALPFVVTGSGGGNPIPNLSSLSPNSRAAGGGAFTLTANGAGFVNGAVVRWNGANRPTTFVSAGSLNAAIPAGDIAAQGTASVTVFNPGPGGGVSNALSFAVTGGAPPPPPPGGVRTVVSLTFDDTYKDHVLARQLLDSRGMKGTFFINSPRIGADPLYMNRADVDALRAAGHEIGGHTLNHLNLPTLSAAEARRQVCDDRQALVAAGYAPVSFAYPFGANNASIQAMARDCGYTSARTVGGIGCASCPKGETLPPANVMSARTPNSLQPTMSLGDIQRFVTDAEQAGGGWVNLVVHRICPSNCSTDATKLAAFLDWLGPRAAQGTVVRTQAAALAGTAPPPPPPGGLSISALSPNTRPAGGAAFNLTVDGTGFVSGAVVRWNGLNRPGVLQGTTRLIVYIGPNDVASPRTASVTVANPNGAVSNALPFTVTSGGPAAAASPAPASETEPAGALAPAAGVRPAVAQEFAFRQTYAFPNPSRRGQPVTIRTQTGPADSVEVRVFDVSGAPLSHGTVSSSQVIDDGNGDGPQHTFDYVWDVSRAGSGVYVYVVEAKKAGQDEIRKVGKIGVLK